MSARRLVSSPPPRLTADEACLHAFRGELDYVSRTLRRLGAAPADVDDLVQESGLLLALRRSWSEYDANRPSRPYLFGISFRIAWCTRADTSRRREVASGAVDVATPGPGPTTRSKAQGARALVLAALERIPLPRRAVLVRHEIDDVPVREVAEGLGIPLFTVIGSCARRAASWLPALRPMSRRFYRRLTGGYEMFASVTCHPLSIFLK